jgi:hypothetical protein
VQQTHYHESKENMQGSYFYLNKVYKNGPGEGGLESLYSYAETSTNIKYRRTAEFCPVIVSDCDLFAGARQG